MGWARVPTGIFTGGCWRHRQHLAPWPPFTWQICPWGVTFSLWTRYKPVLAPTLQSLHLVTTPGHLVILLESGWGLLESPQLLLCISWGESVLCSICWFILVSSPKGNWVSKFKAPSSLAIVCSKYSEGVMEAARKLNTPRSASRHEILLSI